MKSRLKQKQGSNVSLKSQIQTDWKLNKYVIFMAIPVVLYYIIFCYIPMIGISIAFFDYNIARGFAGSKFVGLKYFKEFLGGFYAARTIANTLKISFYSLIFGFPVPILLALLLNEVSCSGYKRTVQTITYLPHFISLVVICGMILNFTSADGIINDIREMLGMERVSLLMYPRYFRSVYVLSEIWQGAGWGSILYLSALSGIDTEQYEAATIDGAGRFKRMLHITLPGIAPTIVIMLILNTGKLMSVGQDKIILLYNQNTYETADVISSYVYRRGIVNGNYSFSTAVGVFNSVINFILLFSTNAISKRVNETSLW